MIDKIRAAFRAGFVQWQLHSLERMLVRNISRANISDVVRAGEDIESYPNDTPFPSLLVLG